MTGTDTDKQHTEQQLAMPLVQRAAELAVYWHAGQWRKSFIRRAATEHTDWVVWILARYADANDEVLLAGGHVHDVPEDTDATIAHIAEALGWEVAHLAAELKNPDGLHGPQTKRAWQVAHAPQMSSRARGIKIADQVAIVLEQLFYPHGKTLAHNLDGAGLDNGSYLGWHDGNETLSIRQIHAREAG